MAHDTVPMQQPSNAPPITRMRRSLGPLLVAVVGALGALGIVGFVVSGPYRTLRGLQTAIAFNDARALNDYVDFPTLRANLKRELNARTRARVNAAVPNGFLSQVASGIAGSIADAAVDTLVTPSGLNKLVLGASIVNGQPQGEPSGTLAQRFESGSGEFETTDRFAYTISPGTSHEVTLILTRSGLSWQLTNVLLPVEP